MLSDAIAVVRGLKEQTRGPCPFHAHLFIVSHSPRRQLSLGGLSDRRLCGAGWNVFTVATAGSLDVVVEIADFAVSRDEWLAGEARLPASYELV